MADGNPAIADRIWIEDVFADPVTDAQRSVFVQALEKYPREAHPDRTQRLALVRNYAHALLSGPAYETSVRNRAAWSNSQDAPQIAAERADEPESGSVRVVTIEELLRLQIPAREFLLEPWLREKETAMVHAWRGVGKTLVGLNVAYALASGGTFLGWRAPRPRPVLYIDGEMPTQTMQERLAAIVQASDEADTFDPAYLRLVCADLQDGPLPNLSTAEGQAALDPMVDVVDLVIVDSISTLASCGRENEAESWLPMQAWALALRRRGKSVLLFHHDGKGGHQRGTSRKEDILDVVISLRHPADYDPTQGARFEVHYKKARAFHGKDAEPFEATLEVVDGRAVWTTRRLEDAELARAAALYRDGCKPADVAQELNVSRATAYRLKKKAGEKGLLS